MVLGWATQPSIGEAEDLQRRHSVLGSILRLAEDTSTSVVGMSLVTT